VSAEIGDVAERSGVDSARIATMLELGILGEADLAGETAVRKVKLVDSLTEGGIPLETIAEAIRRGLFALDFVDQPSYSIFASYGSETFRQVATRTTIPVETLLAIREAMGSASAEPDEPMRVDELQVVPVIEAAVGAGVRPVVMERMLRVSGDALRRVADTEADSWRSEILEPIIRSGMGAKLGEYTAQLATRMDSARDAALLAIYHAQEAHAWTRNIYGGLEQMLDDAGVRTTAARLPAICFLDLTGYTRLTESEGDAAAADLAVRLGALVQRTSSRHGGKAVKWLGDGVMFHFADAAGAVQGALEMVEAAASEALPPAHVGIHAGPVLFQEGDYFGRTVNVAARVADYARPGEVLVTAEVTAVAPSAARFGEIGAVELKGLGAPVQLFLARRPAASGGG
jgi:adenylate cyclase